MSDVKRVGQRLVEAYTAHIEKTKMFLEKKDLLDEDRRALEGNISKMEMSRTVLSQFLDGEDISKMDKEGLRRLTLSYQRNIASLEDGMKIMDEAIGH